MANPNPADPNVPVVLTATVSDAATGDSNVASAEYNVNGGEFIQMNPADGAFDQATENVTATVPPFSPVGQNTLCVRGTDADGNVGASECIMLPVSSETCVQPPPGAISWWPLDETSGMMAADRVGNHPGAYASGPVPAVGKVRGALRFNGSNHVAVADSDLWAFGANNFTIELWANFDAPGSGSIGEPGDIFIGNDEGPGLVNKWFFALGGGVLDFTVFNVNSPPSNLFLVRAPFSPIVGQWYHLAVTKRGTLFTIFVNGTPVGSEISISPIANANAPLTIGQAENIGFMNGRLDEISIYNRALTEEELQAVYDAGSAGKCINLSIRPDKGGDTGSVSVHINGAGFVQGATVKLVRAGQTDIVGSPVTVGTDGTSIDTAFDLTGKTRGMWDVVVMNPDGTVFTLPQGFTIEESRAPQVWVDIVGLNLIRPGRAQSFHVFYGNRGNVDAIGVPLWIRGIPANAVVTLGFDFTPLPTLEGDESISPDEVPNILQIGSETVVPLLIPRIPPGEGNSVQITLTIPPETGPFSLRAWASAPLLQKLDNIKCITDLIRKVLPQHLQCEADVVDEVSRLLAELMVTGKPGEISSFVEGLSKVWNACIKFEKFMRIQQAVEVIHAVIDGIDLGEACASILPDPLPTSLTITSVNSFDPNDKIGSQGASEEHFLSGDEPLRYSIFFENIETANAPAQEVVVTDQLDTVNMDLSTLSFGPIAFGNKQVIPTPGASAFATDVDLRPDKNLIVRITASLNPNTGILTWRLTSIDPATGNPPEDPLLGFLPPDINPPEGDGSVLFTVMPKKGLATGTEIRNKARIIFDVNEPIDTPEWFNTIDNSQPASNVLPLTASQCASDFQVQWAGTDEGSGIANYTIYVSDNGAPFTIWQNTTATSGIYAGQFNHTYAFYSLAQDKTGNIENPPPNPDATVNLSAPAPPIFTSVPPAITVYTGQGATACGTFVSDATLGMTTAQSPCSTVNVTRSGVPTGNIFPVGNTTITYMATDADGNTAAATQAVTVIDNTPPTITSESVSLASLWPPNHTLREVTVNYAAVDNCSSTCTLSVTSNEPVNGTGDGDTEPDWAIVDAHHVRLRAERAAIGNGRKCL